MTLFLTVIPFLVTFGYAAVAGPSCRDAILPNKHSRQQLCLD